MRRWRTVTIIVVAAAVIVVGVVVALPRMRDAIPRWSDSLSVYTRNQSDDGYGMSVESGWLWTRQGEWGLLGGSRGCSAVQPGWRLSVGRAGRDGAIGPYTVLFGDDDLGPSPEVWIDVAPDGTVSWGEGQPEWAPDPAPDTCG